MRKIILILCFSSFLNCSQDPASYLDHINGYWEIEEVILKDGTKKKYTYNDTVDFISINDSMLGYRKKLKPNFNNRYTTSDDAESIIVLIENDSLNLYYSTAYSKWKETILMASDEQLKVMTQNKAVYLYKRYTPINLDID